MPAVFPGYISGYNELVVLLSPIGILANIKFLALFFEWGNKIPVKNKVSVFSGFTMRMK